MPPKTPPKTTPVKPHANTIHTHGSTALRAHNFRAEYASEAIGMFVGPMPYKVFLDMFLPEDPGTGRKTKPVTFQDVPVHAAVEVDLYDPLVRISSTLSPIHAHITLVVGQRAQQMLPWFRVLCFGF